MTIGPGCYGSLGRLGNAIYVIVIGTMLLLLAQLSVVSLVWNSSRLPAENMVIMTIMVVLGFLVLWGMAWVIRWALGGGPAKR